MNIVMGNIVKIVPLPDACSRTKSEISEHGGEGFEIVSFNPRSQRFGSTPAVLLRSLSGSEFRHENWVGWFPLLEIGESNDK